VRVSEKPAGATATPIPLRGRAARSARLGLLALALAALASLLTAGSASAIYSHNVVQAEFATGCSNNGGTNFQDLAVDEAHEWLYYYCEGFTEGPSARIFKVNYSGAPVNWGAVKPYVAGNELIGNPGAANGSLAAGFAGGHIAVDNSGGVNEGLIYVLAGSSGLSGGSDNIQIFKPNGEFVGSIVVPSFGGGDSKDVDVGPDGSIYFLTENRVSKYNTGYNEVARMYTSGAATFSEGNRVVADTKGAVWTVTAGPTKFEPDQLFTNYPPSLFEGREEFTGTRSPYVPFPLLTGGGETNGVHIATDPNPDRNDLYVNRGNKIEVFSEGSASEPSYANGPAFGIGVVARPGITVTKDHQVFATAEGAKIIRFGPGDILPDVHTHQVDVDHIGHESAELDGEVQLDGGTPVTSCELEYGLSNKPYSGSMACSPSSFGSDTVVSAEPGGLTTGSIYHYRFKATNQKGANFGVDRTFVPAYVLKVKTLAPSPIAEHQVTLRGSLDPDGSPTEYHFQFGVTTSYDQETEWASAGEGSGVTTVSEQIQNLPSGKTFHYRIVAKDENEHTTAGEDRVFRTASTPDISGLQATDLSETSAVLHATINPVGYPTKYHFDYGPTTSYGQSIPVPDEDIGSGEEPVQVEQEISGLTPGVTYHFRVVATNEPWGSSVSTDTTFDYAPPTCPNDHVRQETASTFLPDCRAYELVSPGAAGAVQLFPAQEAWDLYEGNQDPLAETGMWALNNGLASGPPRFMFYGLLGTVNGLAAPNLLTTDSYLATRTSSGWVTTLPGLDDHYGSPSGKECADSMSRCLEYNTDTFGTEERESEAYVFTAEGKFVERLPQTSNLVPHANEFKGYRRTSGDFTNYAFSSNEAKGIFGEPHKGVAFTVDGLTTGAGSAYDNDLQHRTVALISRLPGGGMIPQNGASTRPMQLPGISTDGSHILMMTEGGVPPGPPYHLYMSVNDSLHYDVSKGAANEFVGMTRDGSSVAFTSEEQLTSDDEDESIDLYRWHEATDSLTLLSVGNGNGKAEDDCNATWIAGCGVEVPNTERRYAMLQEIPFNNMVPYFEAQGLDDVIAQDSGDVYFYSPQLLDGSRFGIPNQRNLYVARPDGSVQFVATLDSGTEVNRMTIARDGNFAAFLTPSQLTSYDNRGFREVYVYDAETESLVCASCRPGAPPTKDVTASFGGPFMADDGRAFFATKDSLVPRDKNGEITDVYEYVGGRPQLISGALASRDFTGESEVLGLFARPEHTGLESVSRDGLDVYFSTFATMVDEDHNGQFLKFYDARTSGGFAQPPVAAPCEAADECHGADSSPPAPPTVSSGTNLGTSGNLRERKRAKKKKHAKHRRKKGRRHRGRARRRAHAQRRHLRQRSHGGRSNG
jgi:hypothetical protein